ncbi:hypothetical protein [Kamptonema formosum]|uniref:hypothetical protein n=1 Tax=Kamptonema formosum TaxID=331992 RepID=UPI000346BB01|nr:hypothetical protein [Kamptonema formosum]
MALLTETLERRFDSAFGITRTEEERNELLSQRVQQLQRDLEILGNAYAAEDEIRSERDYYERLLRENGIDPWRVPGGVMSRVNSQNLISCLSLLPMPRGFCRAKHDFCRTKSYLNTVKNTCKNVLFSLLLGYAKTGLTGCVQRLQINYKLYRQRV